LPGNEVEGQVVLEAALEALGLFTELYGPYPYPELIVAQNGYYGAMEYSGLVSMSGYAYDRYEGKVGVLLVSLTAHEVAHQWWYGAVGNDQVHEPWLDESLATFSELLFYEQLHPEEVRWWWSSHVDRWKPSGCLDSTIYDYPDTWSCIRNVYGQGVRFLRDLRALLGEETFFAFLQTYRARNEGRVASSRDWMAVLCTHVSEYESSLLNQVLESYFESPHYCE
jgi:aminopeptidase N